DDRRPRTNAGPQARAPTRLLADNSLELQAKFDPQRAHFRSACAPKRSSRLPFDSETLRAALENRRNSSTRRFRDNGSGSATTPRCRNNAAQKNRCPPSKAPPHDTEASAIEESSLRA